MRKNLINYLPEHLRNINEFNHIMSAEQTKINALWTSIENLEKDQFITTATLSGIKHFEKIFNISPGDNDTFEERRFAIIAKIIRKPPFTLKALKNELETLCGAGNYSVGISDYTLTVRIGLSRKAKYYSAEALVNALTPENINIDMTLLYNSYEKLEQFTHVQLSNKTHGQLRSEVI